MKKTMFLVSAVLLFSFILLTAAFCQPARKPVKLSAPGNCTIIINSKTFTVQGISSPRGLLLDSHGLGVAMKLSVRFGDGTSVIIGNKTFRKSLEQDGKRYIPSEAFASQFGYTLTKTGENTVTFSSSGGTTTSSTPSSGGKTVEKVELNITSKSKSDTSKPGQIMWTVEVKFTNKGDKAVQFNNNNLVLEEESGQSHRVTRARFASEIFINPGESKSSDRIYFTMSADAAPKYLVLKKSGVVLGKTSF